MVSGQLNSLPLTIQSEVDLLPITTPGVLPGWLFPFTAEMESYRKPSAEVKRNQQQAVLASPLPTRCSGGGGIHLTLSVTCPEAGARQERRFR